VTPEQYRQFTCNRCGVCCEDIRRLVVQTRPQIAGQSHRLPTSTRLGLLPEIWTTIAERVAKGEPLRKLGREFGGSHECIRRTARGVEKCNQH
jgi:hypothetical protein